MKILTTEEKKILLELLIDDTPFTKIREELGVNKNYNIKNLCEYLGGKYLRAYKLHINNYKSNSNGIVRNALTKTDFLNGLNLMFNKIKEETISNNLLEAKDSGSDPSDPKEEIIILSLPKVLPARLQGENYQIKQTSIKLVDNVWQEFQQFAKTNKTYSTIEYLSLAILEFLEKYNG